MSTSTVENFLNGRELDRSGITSASDHVLAALHNYSCFRLDEAVAGWKNPTRLYRGQRNSSWGLRSSLARLLSEGSAGPLSEKMLCDAELAVLEQARNTSRHAPANSGRWLGRNLSAGELMAVLQHQEVPTRFIDVTADALTALYFACDQDDRTDGRLFVLLLKPISDPIILTSVDKSWQSVDGLPWPLTSSDRYSNSTWTNKVFHIQPGWLDPRMSAQKGSFIVGGLARAYSDGPVGAPASDIHAITSLAVGFRKTQHQRAKVAKSTYAFAWTIRIPSSLKPDIRSILYNEHGIGHESLFPDYANFRRLGRFVAGGQARR